jgi:hypothetical protein
MTRAGRATPFDRFALIFLAVADCALALAAASRRAPHGPTEPLAFADR